MHKKEHTESGTWLYYFIKNTLESVVVNFEAISVSFLLSFFFPWGKKKTPLCYLHTASSSKPASKNDLLIEKAEKNGRSFSMFSLNGS